MSDYRVTCGLMAELATAIPKSEISEMMDKLDELQIPLHLNYEGTLVYTEDVDVALYNFEIQIGSTISTAKFKKLCSEHGFEIVGKPQNFVTVWYDGVDSVQSDLTLKKFKERK